MNSKLLKAFEKLLHDGCYAEAEEQLQQIIKLSPEDWQAKMLFGTCRLFQGDIKTAEQIHKEVEMHYSAVTPTTLNEKTFWQKYHRWIIYGCAGATLLVTATAVCGGAIDNTLSVLMHAISQKTTDKNCVKYAGPAIDYYCKACGSKTSIAWGFIEDKDVFNSLKGQVNRGLLPCRKCGKDTPFSVGTPADYKQPSKISDDKLPW